MKISYFTGKYPNFGDDLNLWMWPKILPDFFDEDDKTVFLGIGSIIGEKVYSPDVSKIIFGSGYVPKYHDKPDVKDGSWNIYFVRGPRTAKLLDISPDLALGDSAILLRAVMGNAPKSSEVISFMPHWESLDRGHWESACKLSGINLIDPRQPVEKVLNELLRSKMVIAEAMHGAIVSDALRIPWVPIMPLNRVHTDKWFDWAEALEINLQHKNLFPSSLLEARLSFLRKPINALPFKSTIEKGLTYLAANSLMELSKVSPCLSKDTVIESVTTRMLENVAKLKNDYKRGFN